VLHHYLSVLLAQSLLARAVAARVPEVQALKDQVQYLILLRPQLHQLAAAEAPALVRGLEDQAVQAAAV
jgi:hypothetical protein